MILVDTGPGKDPYTHAALEEYLVRQYGDSGEDLLLLYINTPCVVVGKNQSICRELNFAYLRAGKTIVRRLSGGGSVYHDPGNLCFAFISRHHDSKVNNYALFNAPVVAALRKAGIEVSASPRNDLLWQGRKVSGNAQFTNRKAILSHGTLLVNTDLGQLRAALQENSFAVRSRAVASVRSSVANLAAAGTGIKTAAALKDWLLAELPVSGRRILSAAEWQAIDELAAQKYRSMDWIWGRNPYTVVTKTGGPEITSENGRILSITEDGWQVLPGLSGCYYHYQELKQALAALLTDAQEQAEWLERLF